MPHKPDDKLAVARLRAELGARVRAGREELGWSQERLAESVGVSAAMLGRYERGLKLPSHLTLVRLASALGSTTDTLLGAVVAGARAKAPPRDAGPAHEIARRLPALSASQLRAVSLVVRELVTAGARRRDR